jgi:predicted aspartyl protease
MKGMLMLVDTGATISILPYKIYEELKEDQKGELQPTDMIIRTGTNAKVDVRGIAQVQFDLEGQKFKYPFYICGDARNPIIGFDFQAKYDMYLRPGENALYIGKRKLPCFDHTKFWNRAKVTMYQQYTIEPQHEAIVQGQVLRRDVSHNNKICVVDKVASCLERTGALVCRTTSKVQQGLVPVRLINVTAQPITIRKGSVVGILEPVATVEQMQVEEDQSTTCTCKCDCLKANSKSDSDIVCCHQLSQFTSHEERYQFV